MKPPLRIPPLFVTVIAGLAGWVMARTCPALTWESPAHIWLATAGWLLGTACSVLGVAAFRRARTTVNPMQLDGTTALVISGIYRVTRNPMYLGFLFLLLGEIAWLANPVALLIVPAFILYLNRFQIIPEENALRGRFGQPYFSYAAQVRRWI